MVWRIVRETLDGGRDWLCVGVDFGRSAVGGVAGCLGFMGICHGEADFSLDASCSESAFCICCCWSFFLSFWESFAAAK